MRKSSKELMVMMQSAVVIVFLAMLLVCNGLTVATEIDAAWRGPDYLIIGVQKSGTTALYNYIIEHPKIVSAKQKEVHFFDEDMRFNKGIEWYREQLNYSKELGELLYGEASPRYFSPVAPLALGSVEFLRK
jgi:hypothetical protein